MKEKALAAVGGFFRRVGKLIDVKSIVTLVLTAVFAYLAVRGQVGVDQFLTVFTVIIAFYFGTQAQKAADKGKIEDPPVEESMNVIGFDTGEG